MSYIIEKSKVGRKPFTIIEVDLPSCVKNYGETSTNLLLYSDQIDNAIWVKDNIAVSSNSALSPAGDKTADSIVDDNTSGSFHRVRQNVTLSANDNFTFSCYVKANGRNGIALSVGSLDVFFNIKSGILISSSSAVDWNVELIVDDWYRVSLTSFFLSTTYSFTIYMIDDNNSPSYDGDGVSGIYLWGVQIERSSTPRHYTRTTSASLSSSCTASGAIGTECKNTRFTCQDIPNYIKILKTYRFTSATQNLPIGQAFIPCLEGDPKFTPVQILPDRGASIRGEAQFTLRDFTYHDRGVDKYAKTRTYNAEKQGTFLGRLIYNNPYYVKSLVRIKTGYISSTGYNPDDFETKLYMLHEIKSVKQSGVNSFYTFICKDLLKLADNKRVILPSTTDGGLNAQLLTATTSSFVLDGSATLSDYPIGLTRVKIGSEILSYASRSGSTCSTLIRGLEGTLASDHNLGDGVQVGINFTGNPVSIIDEILETYALINGDIYIPYDAGLTTPTGTNDEWDDEASNWLSGINLNVWFYDPTGAMTLLNELCVSFQIDLWFDEVSQKVKLKVNAPPLGNSSVTELNDVKNLIDGKTKVKDITKKRLSRVVMYYDKIDSSKGNSISNFRRHHFEKDDDAEDPDTYNEVRTLQIMSRWLTATQDVNAIQTAQRILARFGTTPREIKFNLDAKDSKLWTGDLCDINTKMIQDGDGLNKVIRFQITKVKEITQGSEYEYTGLESAFNSKRNAFFADNASPQYGSASDAQKLDRAYFSPDSGSFSDGGEPYLFI